MATNGNGLEHRVNILDRDVTVVKTRLEAVEASVTKLDGTVSSGFAEMKSLLSRESQETTKQRAEAGRFTPQQISAFVLFILSVGAVIVGWHRGEMQREQRERFWQIRVLEQTIRYHAAQIRLLATKPTEPFYFEEPGETP